MFFKTVMITLFVTLLITFFVTLLITLFHFKLSPYSPLIYYYYFLIFVGKIYIIIINVSILCDPQNAGPNQMYPRRMAPYPSPTVHMSQKRQQQPQVQLGPQPMNSYPNPNMQPNYNSSGPTQVSEKKKPARAFVPLERVTPASNYRFLFSFSFLTDTRGIEAEWADFRDSFRASKLWVPLDRTILACKCKEIRLPSPEEAPSGKHHHTPIPTFTRTALCNPTNILCRAAVAASVVASAAAAAVAAASTRLIIINSNKKLPICEAIISIVPYQ